MDHVPRVCRKKIPFASTPLAIALCELGLICDGHSPSDSTTYGSVDGSTTKAPPRPGRRSMAVSSLMDSPADAICKPRSRRASADKLATWSFASPGEMKEDRPVFPPAEPRVMSSAIASTSAWGVFASASSGGADAPAPG